MLTFSIFIIIYGLIAGGYKGFTYKKSETEKGGMIEIRLMPVLFPLAVFYIIYYIVNYLIK